MRKLMSFCLLFFAVAGLAIWGFGNLILYKGQLGLILLSENDVELGDLWVAPDYRQKLTFCNKSASAIDITRFVTSCSCIDVQPSKLKLEPGRQAAVTIRLNLYSAFSKPQKDPFVAPFEATLTPVANGRPLVDLQCRIRGLVLRPVVFDDNPLTIKDKLTQGLAFPKQAMRLKFAPSIKTDQVALQCNPAFGSVELAKTGDENKLLLTLDPHLPSGPLDFPVVFNFGESSYGAAPPVSLAVSGMILQPIQIRPEYSALEAGPIGREVQTTISLFSPVGQQFVVEGIETPDKEVVVEQTEQPGVFRLRVKYSRTGQQTCTAWFFVRRAQDEAPLKISHVIKYFGLSNQNQPAN